MRCAVLGKPIAHSLSPVLHRAGYAALGLTDWSYDAVEMDEAGLPAYLDALPVPPRGDWRGLSLTMPLKRTLVPLVDSLDERATQAQAANTVVFESGPGGVRRLAYNTDVPGAVAAIRERYDGPVETATVVGGGATAASVLLALADLGCRRARLLVRSPERAAETLAAVARHPSPPEVGFLAAGEAPGRTDVLVSTVPASAQQGAQGLEVLAHVPGAACVFDVIYDPWPTPLATVAADAGAALVSGLDLLAHQAALQFELFTGQEAPLAAMRTAGEAALAERRSRDGSGH